MNPCQPVEDAIFLFIGPRLLEDARLPEDWARSAERRVRDCPQGSMLGRSVQYLGQVLGQRVPVAVSELFDDPGEETKLRGPLEQKSAAWGKSGYVLVETGDSVEFKKKKH